MTSLVGVLAAASELEHFCRGAAWQFCFIGGVAVNRWGQPRFTKDVDVTLLTGFGHEEVFVDALLQNYEGRLRDAREFALRCRVLLARTRTGVDLDISLGGLPFEENCVQRSSVWKIGGTKPLTTCSAEDLIVLKVFAGRDRDWSDIEGVLIRQRGQLDLTRIRGDLRPLMELKEDAASLQKLERLIAQVNQRAVGAGPDSIR
jgi:hypothetical protein